uniref:sodium-coupled monocarboxylate transporter 1 isoform X2 n=1 Tax=Ciona intestinalis TaxID=7719 RepID=UPI000180C5A9|nr:sodium-coupled monocarboxylate transporter 1 isoform X2 [Ciona intestinalis]|eukprot:XP_002121367.1 sodium-coupled monocarboxylate transporter 1 isoform X2 [Ciona intestinalis]
MSAVPTTLAVADYAVFGVTLGISAAIGIFYAIKDWRSTEGTEGYLLGGRNLGMIPVSLSLSVSFMSAVTVLGTPAEVYLYGTMYWWFLLSMLIVAVVTSELYIPTFYHMGISSTYEYLEARFNRPVRVLATITFILETIFYVGIVIYAPSLALSAVTGFDLWSAVLSTGLVCTFYTTLGGIKAVIWTDVFQAVVMLCGFLAVTIRGSVVLGGYENVWKICEEGGRVDFLHFDLDPRYRHTFWSIIVGGTFLWLGVYAVSQSQVQRYLCCRSVNQAKGAIYLNWLGLVIIISLSVMNGAILYAFYHDCDPLSTGKVGASDQLLPYMALELFKDYPGLTGLVVSCVFSGSLSTVSSGINAMSCVTVEDFIKPATKWSETTYTWLSKGAVIIYGGLCIAMAYLASQLGGVLEAALSILGLVGGPLVGLFTLGMMFPFANSIGAFVGLLSGLAVSTWVYIGSKTYPPDPIFVRKLPVDISGCPVVNITSNATIASFTSATTPLPTTTVAPVIPAIADFYSISYVYYSCVGFGTTLVIGLVLSLLTCGWRDRKKINPKLVTSIFDHWLLEWIPQSFRDCMRCQVGEEYRDWEIDMDNLKEYNTKEMYTPAMIPELGTKRQRTDTVKSVSSGLSDGSGSNITSKM